MEHVFIGDALRTLWQRGVLDVEVLRSKFYAHGYDLIMAQGKIVRHIQFKTGIHEKPQRVSVGSSLADKPSDCVIWIQVDNVARCWTRGAVATIGRTFNQTNRANQGRDPPVAGETFRGKVHEQAFGDHQCGFGASPFVQDLTLFWVVDVETEALTAAPRYFSLHEPILVVQDVCEMDL